MEETNRPGVKRAKTSSPATGVESNGRPPIERFLGVLTPELVIEVFSWLLPWDILNLLEVNRGFRNLLRKKSSAPAWRNARKNVELAEGLPDCPKHLTEIQYTRTIFDVHCSYCGEETDRDGYEHHQALDLLPIDYSRFVRVCSNCQKTLYGSYRRNGFNNLELPKFCGLESVLKVLSRIIPGYQSPWDTVLLRRDVDRVLPQLIAFYEDIENKKSNSQQALLEYITKHEEQVRSLEPFVKRCWGWQWDDGNLAHLAYDREWERRALLKAKIAEMGYDPHYISFWGHTFNSRFNPDGIKFWVEFDDAYVKTVEARLRPTIKKMIAISDAVLRASREAPEPMVGSIGFTLLRVNISQEETEDENTASMAKRHLQCRHCSGAQHIFGLGELRAHAKEKHSLDVIAEKDYLVLDAV